MGEIELVTIGDVCIKASSNISQNKLQNIEGDFPIYGASGFIKNVDFYHQEKPYLSIVKDGSGVGRVTKMPAKTSVIGTLQYILPKQNVNLDYLYYSLIRVDFKKYVAGAAIPHIYFKDYQIEPFLLVSLSEQQAIVEKLDAAFELIDRAKANIEQNIQNAKELFQSKLQSIFIKTETKYKYQEKRFDEICVLQRGFDLPTRLRKKGPFPLVSSNGVTDNISEYKVQGPGVITGRSGTIGKVHFIAKDFWPLNTALYIKDFHGNAERFIYYFLQCVDLTKYASGAGVPTLNRNFIHSEKFQIITDREIQNKIVLHLDQLAIQTNILIQKYQQKLTALEELRKSILEKAFQGKWA